MSAVFAIACFTIADDYEHFVIERLLADQAEAYFTALSENPKLHLPRSAFLSVYTDVDSPEAFQGLGVGVVEPGHPTPAGVHVAVFEESGRRLLFVIDLGRIESIERYFLWFSVMAVLCGTALSGWMGSLLASRTIRPVSRLAESIEQLPVRPVRTNLASDFGPDEIGILAAAIDEYQRRLADADNNERQFFADASHELRTPVSVIQGTLEVLQDDPETSPGQRIRFARVERSIAELAFSLEALLLSARGLPQEVESIDLEALCHQSMQRQLGWSVANRDRFEVRGLAPRVEAPGRWVACILDVLYERLGRIAPESKWIVELSGAGLTIHQASDSGSSSSSGSGSGSGEMVHGDLGLSLVFVERLCRSLGWRLEQRRSGDGRIVVSLDIPREA